MGAFFPGFCRSAERISNWYHRHAHVYMAKVGKFATSIESDNTLRVSGVGSISTTNSTREEGDYIT